MSHFVPFMHIYLFFQWFLRKYQPGIRFFQLFPQRFFRKIMTAQITVPIHIPVAVHTEKIPFLHLSKHFQSVTGHAAADPVEHTLADLRLIKKHLPLGLFDCCLHTPICLLIPLLTLRCFRFLPQFFPRFPVHSLLFYTQIQAAPCKNSLYFFHLLLILPGNFPAHQHGENRFHIPLFFYAQRLSARQENRQKQGKQQKNPRHCQDHTKFFFHIFTDCPMSFS